MVIALTIASLGFALPHMKCDDIIPRVSIFARIACPESLVLNRNNASLGREDFALAATNDDSPANLILRFGQRATRSDHTDTSEDNHPRRRWDPHLSRLFPNVPTSTTVTSIQGSLILKSKPHRSKNTIFVGVDGIGCSIHCSEYMD